MNTINIAASSDWRYAQHLGAMLLSVLDHINLDCFVQFYIIDGGIKDIDKEKLEDIMRSYTNVRINYLKIDQSIYENFSISRHIKHASYYRISLPELLPSHVNKVIYLDCDMVIKDNLKKLFDIDLGNCYIAAVSNSENEEGKYNYLGIQETCHYFNAGMLVIDLVKWRKAELTSKIINYISSHPEKIIYEDQDALNIFLHNKCLLLHPKWNQTHFLHVKDYHETCFCKEDYLEAKNNPSIIHYTAASKPWRYLDIHPFKSEYYKYLKLSKWSDYTPVEKRIIHSKKIIIFGASGNGELLVKELKSVNVEPLFFIDNNPQKCSKGFLGKKVYSPNILSTVNLKECLIIIASDYYDEISKQLENMNLVRNKNFVIKNYEYMYQYE